MVYATLILLVIVSVGYLFFACHPSRRFELKRLEGKVLSVRVSIAGFFIVFSSYALASVIHSTLSRLGCIPSEWLKWFLIPDMSRSATFGSGDLPFLLTPFILLTLLLSILKFRCRNRPARELAMNSMDTFERLLLREQRDAITESSEDDRQIRLVLDNDKVYIGYVLAPDPRLCN